jgi:hypothetical protein
MLRLGVLFSVLLCAGNVLGQTQDEAPVPSKTVNFKPLNPDKLPAVVHLETVLAVWADGTESEQREISKTLAGDEEEVARRFAKLQAAGKFAAVNTICVSTVEGATIAVQSGRTHTPKVTSVTGDIPAIVTSDGPVPNPMTSAEFAPLLIANDQVVLRVRLHTSGQPTGDDLPAAVGTSDGKKASSIMTTQFSLEGTLRLSSGRTIVAAGASSKTDRHLLLITAKVTP